MTERVSGLPGSGIRATTVEVCVVLAEDVAALPLADRVRRLLADGYTVPDPPARITAVLAPLVDVFTS